ncbi:MAG: response regulator transcription factor [Planctomycetota bacterium]|nr:response regulator transcription factor [Planctomycetota bacterium]
MAPQKPHQPAKDKIKVLIVDDHPIVREGLAHRINRQPDLVVCAEAASVPEALKAISACVPDLAVVDLSLDGRSGLELIRDIKDRYPKVIVLVLSIHDEPGYAKRSLQAGARGYVMKHEATDNVILAIRRVLGGDIYLSDRLASKLLSAVAAGGAEASPVEGLSDREVEVLELIGKGVATREIAERLHVSVKTVEAHRANIKEKLRLEGATELAHYAFQWVQGRTKI